MEKLDPRVGALNDNGRPLTPIKWKQALSMILSYKLSAFNRI